MRKLILALCAVLSMAFYHTETASAEVGLDLLGIKSRHWDCNAMLAAVNTLPHQIAVGAFLDDTFGSDDRCLRRLLASGKISKFRGHLAWTAHKTVPASVLAPRARYINALAAEYPRVEFIYSGICEHHMTAQESRALNAALRPLMPLVRHTVDSGMYGKDPTALPEVHSNRASSMVISQDGGTNGDGNGLWDVDVEQVKRNGKWMTLLWDKSSNCRRKDDKRRPAERTDCPTADQFNHMVRLSFSQPAWPPGQRLTNKQIWKPLSDNHGGCKGKDCKPVYITPTRQPRINITTLDGRVLGHLRYFGSYQGGGHRYYLATGSGQTAFQLGQQAETLSGSEFAVLNDGRNKFVFNPYRRGGLMR